MGYNDENVRLPIVCDIETAAHPCAADFIEPLNLDGIVAAKNLRDPEKIAEDIRRRRAEAEAAHAESLARAALDWNLSRIVALGWTEDGGQSVHSVVCENEIEERQVLEQFWTVAAHRVLIGFAIRNFDAPTLMQRSLYLGVPYRRLSLARYNNGSLIDLRDVLTYDDMRYEALMPRSLKMFCKRFGITVDDPVNGKDIAALVAANEWDQVLSHVQADVRLTAALAQRVGVLAPVPV